MGNRHRTALRRIAPAAAFFLFLPGAAPSRAQSPEGPERVVELGRVASRTLGGALLATLTASLAIGGPAAAVEVCSRRAGELADSVSGVLGVEVRRVSERYRNPRAAPSSEEATALRAFAREGAPEETVFVASDSAGTHFRYLRPIRIAAATCLRCHGGPVAIAPETGARLAEIYPEDAAVGYALGDLRGAFSVRIPLEALAPSDDR